MEFKNNSIFFTDADKTMLDNLPPTTEIIYLNEFNINEDEKVTNLPVCLKLIVFDVVMVINPDKTWLKRKTVDQVLPFFDKLPHDCQIVQAKMTTDEFMTIRFYHEDIHEDTLRLKKYVDLVYRSEVF